MFAGPKSILKEIFGKIAQSRKGAMGSREIKAIFSKIGWKHEYHFPEESLKTWKAEEKIYGQEMKKYGFIKKNRKEALS